MKYRRILMMAFAPLAAIITSCATTDDAVPAVLSNARADNMAALERALSDYLGRANIDFGAGDPTTMSSVSVLPRRLTENEGNSPARPDIFDLFLTGSSCFAVHRKTGTQLALDGVSCRPA